ncbi:unnamed protein product, partial [marine sediment metagenome]
PLRKGTTLEHTFSRSRGWLNRWPGMIYHLVSRWSWLDRWPNRWLDRWRHRWDNLSGRKSKSLREKRLRQNPRHKGWPLSGKGWKEIEDRLAELLPGYRLAGDDTW